MQAFLLVIAIAFGPLPLDAIRSFACNAGYSWIEVKVGLTEIVEIRSQPSSDFSYYNNMNCTLILTAESSNDRIVVQFSSFRVRAPDIVMLYDGAGIADGWMNSYGSISQPFRTTLTSTMRLNMLTDRASTLPGFVADVYVATASTATARAAPTASLLQSLSSASWPTFSIEPSSSPAGVLAPSAPPSTLSEGSASLPNASSNLPSGSSNDELSTLPVAPRTRTTKRSSGLQSTTNVLSSISSKDRYSPTISMMPRETQDHFYIKYLPGSQISAFQISIPIMLSYWDAPGTWTDGNFGPTILGIASILHCDPKRIQNVIFHPISRFESELLLLILSPRDAYDTTALFLGTKLSYEMQDPSSPLRSIEILDLAPDPPINVTMKEILVTICSNSTYAIDRCPGSNAELASVRQGRIMIPDFVTVSLSVIFLTVLIAIPLHIRNRKKRQPYNASASHAFTSPDAINCEDSELEYPGRNATKHRTNFSFALPTVNHHYQVKRVAYDETHMTLAPDEEQDENYKRRHGSFHFSNEDGNISAME